jgi:hypothetical protein
MPALMLFPANSARRLIRPKLLSMLKRDRAIEAAKPFAAMQLRFRFPNRLSACHAITVLPCHSMLIRTWF